MRQRFRSVPNPLVNAIAREKAHSRNMHPEVISHLDMTNEADKLKFVAKKGDNTLALKRKRQRDDGRSEELCYFQLKKEDKKIPSWSALLFDSTVPLKHSNVAGDNDGKVPSS